MRQYNISMKWSFKTKLESQRFLPSEPYRKTLPPCAPSFYRPSPPVSTNSLLILLKSHPKKNKGGKRVISPEDSSAPPPDEGVPPFDKRLIIILSNCNHTMVRVIPRLVENLNKHGYVEMEKALRVAKDTYEDLDDSLFEAYVEEKSNPIVGAIEQNVYKGGFQWKTCKKPTGVRNYIKDMIMKIIEVHAEVFAVSPVFVTRVTQKVIEAVSEELTRLIQCVTEHGPYSPIQARLELLALQETVNMYLTPHASSCYKDALDDLPVLKPEHKKLQEELLNKFKSQMKFQLMCFYGDNILRSSSEA